MKKLLSAIAVVASLTSASVQADQASAMFSTVDGFNTPQADSVNGVRLALAHGKVNEVKGVDVALLGLSETVTTTGVNVGLFGAAKVNENMTGASLAMINWLPGKSIGLNVGAVNVTNDVRGGNLGLVNYSEGKTTFDMAAVSISDSSRLQFGLVNITNEIKGVQVGLLNCAENGLFKCLPFVNFAK